MSRLQIDRLFPKRCPDCGREMLLVSPVWVCPNPSCGKKIELEKKKNAEGK